MSETPAAPAAPSKAQVFLRRLLSTAVLWSVVLFAIFSGNKLLSDYAFLGIMAVLAMVGLIEFYGLVEKRGLACFKASGVLGAIGGLRELLRTRETEGGIGAMNTPAPATRRPPRPPEPPNSPERLG